jgi:hypothetical protein
MSPEQKPQISHGHAGTHRQVLYSSRLLAAELSISQPAPQGGPFRALLTMVRQP